MDRRMDLSSELRLLLARLHALEVQFIALDDRLIAIERKLDDNSARIKALETGTDKQGG